MPVADVARLDERIDRVAASSMNVSGQVGGVEIRTQIDAMEVAKIMATGKISIPPHLRNNPGDCWAIIMLATEWRMSPISVANKSYSVNNRLAFEASLLQAVVLQRAPIQGRFKVEYNGDGDARTCRVWVLLTDGDTAEYVSPPFGKITPKNSPLWKADPDQQLFYFSARGLCKRHFPDVILGVFAKDELEDNPHIGPDQAKDITPEKPNIGERLKSKGQRGFDQDHVSRQIGEKVGSAAAADGPRKTPGTSKGRGGAVIVDTDDPELVPPDVLREHDIVALRDGTIIQHRGGVAKHVDQLLDEESQTDVQRGTTDKPSSSGPSGDEPRASERSALASVDGAAQGSMSDPPPQNSEPQADDATSTEGDHVDASASGEGGPATAGSPSQDSTSGTATAGDPEAGRAGAAPGSGAPAATQQPIGKPSIFREYADKMNATKSIDGLKGAHRKFRDTRVWPDDEQSLSVLKKIQDTCVARLKEEITAKAARDTLIELIEQGERLAP